MKTFPSSPYHDDYDETKGFYRVLFKPGLPVQARELTQMQTLLQGQIDRFGKNIFKEGSIVIPGEQVYDTNYKYVKLEATYNTINADDVIADLVDTIIIGQTTGVRALVIGYSLAEDSDPPTLFVKYLNSGTNNETYSFGNAEVIVDESSTISVQTVASSATGSGTTFSIGSGALFVKGSFVYFDSQSVVVSKYSVPANIIIGFDISESTVNSDDDVSLLDPAIASYNYFAPGADRYQITLTLNKRDFTPTALDDLNFVEILRIEDGEIIRQVQTPEYNVLQDTLARRTYDESGDYVVRPYRLKLVEHLRTTNASLASTAIDGLYTAANGGNSNLFVSVLSAGKAYVKGYEIDSIRTKYVNVEKARDFTAVNNGTVATQFGNYVFVTNINSIPSDISILPQITLYNRYTSTVGAASGTAVGTARIRSIEYYSGTVGTASAIYKVFLFDIKMNTGYSFADDVKQLYFNNTTIEDFTADISPVLSSLTGTVSTTASSNLISGAGTFFTSELVAGDYIVINSVRHLVANIASNFTANVVPAPTATLSGYSYSLESANVVDSSKNVYIFPLPYNTIKTVDSTNLETIYSVRRNYSRTLAAGSVSITAGTDEVFSGFSSDNYQLIIASGANQGNYIDLTGLVTRSGTPTGKTVTFNLSGLGYTTEDVIILTTLQKTQSAADKKSKTLVSSAIVDYTSASDCTSTVISIGKADIYRVSNVMMSANAFGTAYTSSNAIDITDRFTIDNGQRSTFYDIGTINLKPGSAKPTGPIRITFDYFTHGTGDYFSVSSYSDIDYKDIPSVTVGDVEYKLRDCLDFRPRVNDAGTGFSGAGSSTTEFPDFENDVITDYEYYLPRTDKIVIDNTGIIKVVKGVSSLDPQEPKTPDDSMTLYVLKQEPYVFNLVNDVDIIPIDNKRYTMRDIGRIENRVKNLEYYTTLSLAEQDTKVFQIKDGFGFDRFKNGFVVDSFKGHGIGDVYNSDYATAVDFNKKEARPLCEARFVNLVEIANTNADRLSNNYIKIGDLITLPYTDEVFISNEKASKAVNLNPFNIVLFNGKVTLDPPSDVWFEETRQPDIYRNVEGNYDTFLADARAKGTYGTVWGSWRDLQYGNGGTELIQQRSGTDYSVVESIETSTNNDVVISKVIIPKMRDAVINFHAEGLKPNTRIYAYFNDINVTNYCSGLTSNVANATVAINDLGLAYQTLSTDAAGNVSGKFSYSSGVFNLNTGVYTFKLSDSASNLSGDEETFATAIYTSSGELRNIANEIVSTRNAALTSKEIVDTRSVYIAPTYVPPPPTPAPAPAPAPGPAPAPAPYYYDDWPPPPPPPAGPTYIDFVYQYAFGREPDPEGYQYWADRFAEAGVTQSTLSNMTVSTENIRADGGITASTVDGQNYVVPASYNADAQKVFQVTLEILNGGLANNEQASGVGILYEHLQNGAPQQNAPIYSALQIVTAIANADTAVPANAYYKNDAISAGSKLY